MDRRLLQEIWEWHSGKICGALIGFAVGILVITFGFWRTIFVLLCAGVGYIIGKRIDAKEDFMEIIDRFLPPGYHH